MTPITNPWLGPTSSRALSTLRAPGAFRQFEVSDTRVFDHPQAGRAFFEGVIRDHLDVGRPSLVSLILSGRVDRRTPVTFATKIIAKGVEPEMLLSLVEDQTVFQGAPGVEGRNRYL